ncbi:hypothetical protein BDV25DRAFT_140713 [Aspergillus avenaceus]|uniref:Uncharacterized protein n=1 Tax=Aspergillus avenaceus TaxID=36643 RepID=A0A5N6TT37_ASPAV|nr:hypothetical protein BDV25DRAFT_140713 [Aspergillus avenaceus]
MSNQITTNQPKGNATVQNNCPHPIYLWSVSSTVSPEHPIPPSKSYTETFRRDPQIGGVTLKITTVENGLEAAAPQLNFAYHALGDRVWYSLSDVFGDPFAGKRVALSGEKEIVWENGVPPSNGSQVGDQGVGRDLVLRVC